ncbi:hypothetical protein EMIT0111MI5_270008 [Burkholderia sp. IT-111MI5]
MFADYREYFRQHDFAQPMWRGNANAPTHDLVAERDDGPCLVGRIEHDLASLIEQNAFIGARHRTRVPEQQFDAEKPFEPIDAVANGRLAQAEIFRGPRQIATLDNPHEYSHGRKQIHSPSIIGRI